MDIQPCIKGFRVLKKFNIFYSIVRLHKLIMFSEKAAIALF